ncbi:hypothetical protein [Pseudomonas reidholzensis]|nr:hypothetical protein [Pseudomonas reidholzensis]
MNQAELIRQIEGMEPAMARAYLDQIRATLDSVTIAEIERLIASRDDSALGDVLALGVFAALMELIRSGYIAGGKAEVSSVPSSLGRQELDVNAAGAQSWLAEHIAALKAQMAMDQVDGIRVTVSSGLQAGRSPRQIALDLAGRVSKQTGRRTGGSVGLPGNFAQYVADARTQLRSGDAEQLRKYLTRTRRDKRFDATVLRALKEGRPVAQADADRIAGRYADRLLQTHAQMIARTEALESFGAGRDRVYEQLVERGLPREAIVKDWETRRDEKVRNSHAGMQGQTRALGEPFSANSGALLRYPGDRGLGAGWDETANCRCQARYTIRANYARRDAGNLRGALR